MSPHGLVSLYFASPSARKLADISLFNIEKEELNMGSAIGMLVGFLVVIILAVVGLVTVGGLLIGAIYAIIRGFVDIFRRH